jgi:alginate O-acetyltransferase complex protein AlgI
MLPQFGRRRTITAEKINAALYLILWGYFKKIVIADNAALIANRIFDNYTQYQGFDLLVGVLAFAVQLYCDFSGYSDIARGLAKLLGFELVINFKLPYLATNPGEFWRRWHISLTSWFRDYLWWNMVKKIPMAGRLGPQLRWNAALVAVFLISGLWHGAAWNYVLWGGFHGVLLVIYGLYDRHRSRLGQETRKVWWRRGTAIVATFCCVLVGWVFFRAGSLDQIAGMLRGLCLWSSPSALDMAAKLLFISLPLIIIELWQHFRRDMLAVLHWPVMVRAPLYALLLIWIFVFGLRTATEFLYFQF